MDCPAFGQHVLQYFALIACGLALGVAAGIPAGIAAAQLAWTRAPILTLCNLARAIPSLAMLTFMLPVLGLGFAPAVAALAILALPPIAINTDLGLRGVAFSALDAARGMGMTDAQIFWRVKWPLAFAVSFSGVRTAATEVIASAVLASFIGAGGLGECVTTGLQANLPRILWEGVIAIAAIALIAEGLLAFAQRKMEAQT